MSSKALDFLYNTDMKTLIVGVALMILTSVLAAQTYPDAVKSLVETENVFAAMAGQKGINAAFLATMADGAVIFRPEPTDARKVYSSWEEDSGLLYWVPEFVQVSGAGDLGWTTGPWEYRAEKMQEKPIATGHFVTVWKKQADGSWKWVLDAGVPHPLSGGVKKVDVKSYYMEAPKADKNSITLIWNSLLSLDRAFAQGAHKTWADVAYASGKNLRIYRKGSGIIRAEDKEFVSLVASRGEVIFTPYNGGASESGTIRP